MLDRLFVNGPVRTFDLEAPWASALGIRDGQISFVGHEGEAPAARDVIDLRGRLLTPGIVDSHVHLLHGIDPDDVLLDDAPTLVEVRRRLHDHSSSRPELDWVCGTNVVYSIVEGRTPTAADLEGVSDRPIFVMTYDGHCAWLNEHALRALGILHGGSLAWGRVNRYPDGTATGWVSDFYNSATTEAGSIALQKVIPAFAPDRRYRKLLASSRMAAELGITTTVEPQVPVGEAQLLMRARSERGLSTRVIAALFHPAGSDGAFRQRLLDATKYAPKDDLLRFGNIKLYADDVIEPHTAAMLEEYSNKPGERGRPFYEDAELTAVVTELERLGFKIHTHAIGDWGIRMTLDAMERAAVTNRSTDRRHGVVHVECLHPDDLSRFTKLGVVAAMQMRHASPDFTRGAWMENVGEERWSQAWRVRSLMESGANVALSSDWTVAEMDPLIGIYSALTRATLSGSGSWTPGERITLDQALHGYTRAGAYAWHSEHQFGVLKPGYEADLTVWSENLYDLERDPGRLLDARADLTIVGGHATHDVHAEASHQTFQTDSQRIR